MQWPLVMISVALSLCFSVREMHHERRRNLDKWSSSSLCPGPNMESPREQLTSWPSERLWLAITVENLGHFLCTAGKSNVCVCDCPNYE